MASYATVTQFRQYVLDDPAMPPMSDEEVERGLERAERDVDRFLGWPVPVTDSKRIDVLSLTAFEAAALARAVCAQAGYRARIGEEDLAVPEDGVAAITGAVTVTFADPPPRFSPMAAEELADAGLLLRSGTVPPDAA